MDALLLVCTFLVIYSEGIHSMTFKEIEHKTIKTNFDDLVNSRDPVISSTQAALIYDHISTSKTFSKTSTSQVLMECIKILMYN